MTKNTIGLKERNDAAALEAYKALEDKITKLEEALENIKTNPLGEFSKLNSLVKVLEFEGYNLPNMLKKRTTLYKYDTLLERYENLVNSVKAINNDPASIDPVFTTKLRKALKAELEPEIDGLNRDVEKYAELLTNEQSLRKAAEQIAADAQKEVKRLKKQVKERDDKLLSLTAAKSLRSV